MTRSGQPLPKKSRPSALTVFPHRVREPSMMRLTSLLPALLLPLLPAVTVAEDFKVAGMAFSPPGGFVSVKPSSFMRKAQLKVGVDAGEGEVVFFYFGPRGGGGVEANVKRWFGQFKEPEAEIKAKTEEGAAGKIPSLLSRRRARSNPDHPGDRLLRSPATPSLAPSSKERKVRSSPNSPAPRQQSWPSRMPSRE